MSDLASPITPRRPVSHDEEALLWDEFKRQHSLVARERLFKLYMGFAKTIAQRQHRQRTAGDIDLADVRQLAYAGLLEALDRFDPMRGNTFRTYAAHRITGNILDGLPHMSEVREQLSWSRRRERERLQSLAPENAEHVPDPVSALADLALGLALGFMLEGTGLISAAEDDQEQDARPSFTAYESAAWRELVNRLLTELAGLPEREQLILRYHYMDGMIFDQVAQLLNLSKARISQLHRQALATLQKRLAKCGHFRLER